MGYRSDIRSVIYGDAQIVSNFIQSNKTLINTVNSYIDLEFLTLDNKEELIHLHGSHVKWYEDSEAVIAWEKLLVLSEEAGLDFEFMEIGENQDDFKENRSSNSRYFVGFVRETCLNIAEM